MRVFVTGASGFLGRTVVGELLERGHSVKALLRPDASLAELPWAAKVGVVRGDLRSIVDLEDALEGIDAVVHLAARMSGDAMAQFQGTVLGTERLLEAMRNSQVRRLLLVSSISVYDWRSLRGPLTEEDALEPAMYTRDGYAVAKLWQERICRDHAREHDLDLVVLRPGFLWGPGREWVDGVGLRLGRVVVVLGPLRRLPLAHVDNCADAIAAALTSRDLRAGTFNVFDSQEVRAWRYAGDFVRGAGRGWRIPVPYHLGLLVAHIASSLGRLLLGPRYRLPGILLPQRYLARFRSLHFANAKLRQAIGWRPPYDYAQGLRRIRVGDDLSPSSTR